jgi:hypothetical protein
VRILWESTMISQRICGFDFVIWNFYISVNTENS